MASPFVLASLPILVFSWCCHADEITKVCAQSSGISPTSCALILRSDPHSRGADLKTLAQITIKKAKVAARNTATVAMSVQDLNNTYAVNECVDLCSRAISLLNTISHTLKNLDGQKKHDLHMTISSAQIEVNGCDIAFAESIEGEPAEVAEVSRIAQGLILVLRIIVDKL